METIILSISVLTCAVSIIGLTMIVVSLSKRNGENDKNLRKTEETIKSSVAAENDRMKDDLHRTLEANKTSQDAVIETLRKTVSDMSNSLEMRFESFSKKNDESIERMKKSNEEKLGEIQKTVDEKLQESLSKNLAESLKTIRENIDTLQKNITEMGTMATNVSDLKAVLTNVKTRGNLGEIQLEGILSNIMAPQCWEKQFCVKKGSQERVDFAVKLPGNDEPVYLPIDSKFPVEDYRRLLDATNNGNKDTVDAARKALKSAFMKEAKEIHDKYIQPPTTTEFAIMYLPTEGLYAEAAQSDIIEELQGKFKVNVVGPSTVSALLNSLNMGFKSVQIEKHSAEVFKLLQGVKTQFVKFGDSLAAAQKKIRAADAEIDELVTTRTNQINRALKDVELIPESESVSLLEQSDDMTTC